MREVKLAAIDIGSNAIRFQLTKVMEHKGQHIFKKLEYVRFPLRLGHDVFADGFIGRDSEEKFFKLMHAYKLLLDLYEVDAYMACATSAMREARNGIQVVGRVLDELGLEINIIDGNREAEIINMAISSSLDDKNYLHIDVGGGSTELNVYANREKIAARSFPIGSVRNLESGDSSENWLEMKLWVEEMCSQLKGVILAIGTGGNINKIYDMAGEKEGTMISIAEVERVRQLLKSYSLEERELILKLNRDRADVIVPASDIYLNAMKMAGINQIMVPDVGLKDGMIHLLFQQQLEAVRTGTLF